MTAAARCATAACDTLASAVVDGWPMCAVHAVPEREDRTRSWHAYETLRDWVRQLNAAGVADRDIAYLLGVHPCTVREHRRRLGLPAIRTDRQLAHADRLAREADARVSRCECTAWMWDGHCRRCGASAREAS